MNEFLAGTSPRLKDTDRDGIKDGLEDRDRDGLVNLGEVAAKTNIRVKDTDKDGVFDALEDPDEDGLTNAQDFLAGTNPLVADTDDNGVLDGDEDADEDGLTNAQEFVVETHPRKADTDRDGVWDGEEDFDGDHASNYAEFMEGTDPRDPDSDDDGVLDGLEVRGVVTAFDPESGALEVMSFGDEEDTWQFVVDGSTQLTWSPVDDAEVPEAAPTLDDLYEGAVVCDVVTVEQPDGSLLVTAIAIVVEADVYDPGEGEAIAEVVSWDPDTSVLTLSDLMAEGEEFEVLVDDETAFMWADGSEGDHEPGIDDLVEGAGLSGLDLVDLDDGSLLATSIVLVPSGGIVEE
jgi:hypothetical protein